MAYASYGVIDALAVKLWAKQLAKAERLSLDLSDLMGESENSIIQIKRSLGVFIWDSILRKR